MTMPNQVESNRRIEDPLLDEAITWVAAWTRRLLLASRSLL
jgi:hypothetical protein